MLTVEIRSIVGQENQHFMVVWSVGSEVVVPAFQSSLFSLTSDLEKVDELFCASDFSPVKW